MTEAARPADHATRLRALDPERSFIVQAPAGSGKTELLTRRYLRLLATVRAPEEVLAITFTRKAAAEMRQRVVDALARGRLPVPPDDPHRRETWELARLADAADRRHGWQLADYPARMRILTIDALNQSLARRLPVLSGLGAPLAIATDPGILYGEALSRMIEHLGEPGRRGDAIAHLIAHLDNDLGAVERLLVPLLARREHWLDLGLLRVEMSMLRERLEEALEASVVEQLESIARCVPAALHAEIAHAAAGAATVLEARDIASPIRACGGLTSLPAPTSAALPAWQGLAALLLTASGEWRKPGGVNVRLGFPADEPDRKRRVIDLIETLRTDASLASRLHEVRSLPAARYPEEQWQVLEALLDVLRTVIAELDVVFSESSKADYAAIAIAARRALGALDAPTDLALRLDQRLTHILVDEFQDTSRSQVELLRLLTAGWTRGDGRTLFCVGDPMQSIYRFRDADVGLFLNMARGGLGDLEIEPLRLTVNFRSTRPIVDWVNAAFATILPAVDDASRGAVAHAPSEPRPGASDKGRVELHAFRAVGNEGRRAEAERVTAIARQAWSEDPDATIAVLVSSRNHLPEILAALRAAGMPCRAVEIEPLADRPIVEDLLALTRALTHPADRTAWLSILRAPWCGLTLADLHALAGDDATSTIADLLGDDPRLQRLSRQGRERIERVRGPLLDGLAERGRLGVRERVERTWNALGGPACARDDNDLADAEVFLSRLEEIEIAGELEDVARIAVALGELYGSSLQPGTGRAIEVMTIHKAKGLEYDVVILPGIERAPRADDVPLLRWGELPRVDGTTSLLLAPIAARGSDRDPVHHWLGVLEREKAMHERARLFYVAATRAVRELHLIGALAATHDGEGAADKPARGSFLALAWTFLAAEFLDSACSVASVATATDTQSASGVALWRLPSDWSAPAPVHAVELAAIPAPIEGEPLRPEFDWASETTRHVGTVVHREIERFLRADSQEIDAEQVRARRGFYATSLAELGVPEQRRDAAADRVVAALSAMLSDERGRWLLAGPMQHRESHSELALSGFFGNELVNGVIDRTFVTRDGERWIVDFKTSSHEGGSLEVFLDSEVERYRAQLARYARLMRAFDRERPVRAALYFPLLRAWREVDV